MAEPEQGTSREGDLNLEGGGKREIIKLVNVLRTAWKQPGSDRATKPQRVNEKLTPDGGTQLQKIHGQGAQARRGNCIKGCLAKEKGFFIKGDLLRRPKNLSVGRGGRIERAGSVAMGVKKSHFFSLPEKGGIKRGFRETWIHRFGRNRRKLKGENKNVRPFRTQTKQAGVRPSQKCVPRSTR